MPNIFTRVARNTQHLVSHPVQVIGKGLKFAIIGGAAGTATAAGNGLFWKEWAGFNARNRLYGDVDCPVDAEHWPDACYDPSIKELAQAAYKQAANDTYTYSLITVSIGGFILGLKVGLDRAFRELNQQQDNQLSLLESQDSPTDNQPTSSHHTIEGTLLAASLTTSAITAIANESLAPIAFAGVYNSQLGGNSDSATYDQRRLANDKAQQAYLLTDGVTQVTTAVASTALVYRVLSKFG